MNNIGVRIERIREELGLTVIDFCKKLGVTPQSYHNWIAGKSPSADSVAKLINAYPDYNSGWILTGNGPIKGSKENFTIEEPAQEHGSNKPLTKTDMIKLLNQLIVATKNL